MICASRLNQNNQNNKNDQYFEELQEQLLMEKRLQSIINYQLFQLNEVDQEFEQLKNINDEVHFKCKYMSQLIQKKQQQIYDIEQFAINSFNQQKLADVEQLNQNQNIYKEFDNLASYRMQLINSQVILNQQIHDFSSLDLLNEMQEIMRTELLQMNEELLGLKGNIRVLCRVRPLPNNVERTIQVLDDYKLLLSEPQKPQQAIETIKKDSIIEHQFMKIFDEETKQIDIFNDLKFFLNSFLQGSHICVFTYGPTESGKTHTMFGQMNDEHLKEQLCQELQEYEKNNWQNNVDINIVELYNSKIKDLIVNKSLFPKQEPSITKLPQNLNYEEKVKFLKSSIQKAISNRTVRKTNCNQKSSRSHMILTIKLKAIHLETNKIIQGSLNLIDLAGSERIQMSETTGDGQKETIFINQSLQALSAVIKSLKNNELLIPYRNSLLTQYLKSYLNSQSKTMIILNVSPHPKYYPQTKEALNLLSTKHLNVSTTKQQNLSSSSLHQSPIETQKINKKKEHSSSAIGQKQNKNKKQKQLENNLNFLQKFINTSFL